MAGLTAYGVPIDTNAIPSNINSYIAQGPNYSWIGGLADDYFQGRNAGVQERQQDAFPNGLPRDSSGNIDWNAISDQLAKVGGAGAAQGALNLQLARDAISSANGAQPPSIVPQASSPPSSGNAIPSQNVPAAPNTAGGSTTDMATPGTTGSTNGQTAQPAGTPGAGYTIRQVAQQYGKNPDQLAQLVGVGPDDQLDPNDQATRQAVIGALRGQGLNGSSTGPGAPSAPPSSGGPQAQPQVQPQPQPQVQTAGTPQAQRTALDLNSAPLDQLQAAQQQYEAQAQSFYRKGAALSVVNQGMGARFQAAGDMAAKQAEAIQQAILARGQPTNEEKNARDQVVQNTAVGTAANTEAAKNDQTAFDKQYTGVATLGENAANLAQRIPLAKNLTLNPNFYSGPFHEGVESYNQFKSVFGANPSAATPQEAFNKITNEILADQIKAMGQSGVGRVLQAEVRIMQQGIASLGITAQSNRAQLEMLNRVYQQQQGLAQVADQVKQNIGSIPPMQRQAALNRALTQYQQQHPLFTPAEVQNPTILGAPDAPPQSAQWSPQQKQAWASSVGLKSGDYVRFNGQYIQLH